MKLSFPSPEFDDAVAGVCHGSASEEEMLALNELLRSEARARDEYLIRLELHNRLASEPELFSQVVPEARVGTRQTPLSLNPSVRARRGRQVLALAACLIFAACIWAIWFRGASSRSGGTSTAVAMLTHTVGAQWNQSTQPLLVGGPLRPGTLRLKSGLAQVVFYSGARLVLEGPAELQLISPMEAVCPRGRLLLEVPPLAHGFRLKTPQLNVVDLGTSFGISATASQSEVHVFKGKVELAAGTVAKRSLEQGQAMAVQAKGQPTLMVANAESFASLFEFQERSLASEALRYEQWQFANAQLNQDPSLLVHLDFESLGGSEWALPNAAERDRSMPEALVVGCARAQGRWREKPALEFQSVNDRVRLAVPGAFNGLTLSAWVCIKGLDRKFNSLFMSDGFEPGTVHWLVRNDGVLCITLLGSGPAKFQILASPPVLSFDAIGMWQHLAVVLDGHSQRAVHYLNGLPVSQHHLKFGPPFRVGSAELGNWNARSGPNPAPSLIRNLSGSFDEFELFNRSLTDAEVRELYLKGKPD